MEMDDDDLLAEQRSYYRARAPEYDEWWQRRGRFDRGHEQELEWQRQVAVVDNALTSFGAYGSVLELAGGTGWWTERLARTAEHLTVVDSSPEVLALNRERVGRSDVDYVVKDLYDWRAGTKYDVVFFSFWLSHVPRDRFGEFCPWFTPASLLRAGRSSSTIETTRCQTPLRRIHSSSNTTPTFTCVVLATDRSTGWSV
jgi:SAM-dependent methyltransferase